MIACPPACINRHTGYRLTLFNQLFGKTYVQAPKKRCHPYKTPDALCYAPECELSNILPFKKKPPEAGVASGGFSRLDGKVSGDCILLLLSS